jgi:HPt (histidine-containing phosphotransfer) domain-containing protein
MVTTHQQDQGDILDVGYLARCSAGDTGLERELLTLYMEQASRQLRIITSATDASTFRQALHTLKGCALAVGIRSVASTAERLEEAGSEALDEVGLGRLARDIEAAEVAVRHYLERDRCGNAAVP